MRSSLRSNPRRVAPRTGSGFPGVIVVLAAALVAAGCGASGTPAGPSAPASSSRPVASGSGPRDTGAPESAAPASGAAAPSAVAVGPAIPVLGTENFYADLLGEIGGVRVTATSLLSNPNADPHAFDASPQAAVRVADARLVIVNGFGYDDFMRHLLDASPDASRVVIDVQQLLGLPTDANAHVWYDPGTMPKVAAAAEAALARLEPANAAYFAAREQAYLASLAPLGAKIAGLKATYGGSPVAFTEPVAEYLAKAIGLQVLTPAGFQKAIEDGTDPAPADVAAERDLLSGKQVKVLLFNSQVISPLTTQIRDLAVANGIPVVGVTETMPPQYRTYVEWQLAEMDELGQALAAGA
jgi:zinc/manganese transport system substrate-binding protein